MRTIISTIITALLMMSIVSAFGVSVYPGEIKAKPGEPINLWFELQNMGISESPDYEATVTIGVPSGWKLVMPEGNKYDLPFGTRKKVEFEVTPTSTARIGDKYEISGSFVIQPREEQGSMFLEEIGSKIMIIIANEETEEEQYTPPIIQEEKKQTNKGMIITLIVLILIIITAIIYINKKNRTRKN